MEQLINHRVNVVFEGGGAKGIFHVGALHALEKFNSDSAVPNIEIVGVGGTSIGALVAALLAVGYSADDLIDMDGNIRLQKEYNFKIPTGITGWWAWFFLAKFRSLIRLVFDEEKGIKWSLLLAGVLIAIYGITYYIVGFIFGYVVAFWLCTIVLIVMVGFAFYFVASGTVSLTNFRSLLNTVLAKKVTDNPILQEKYIRDGFKFEDLHSHRGACRQHLRIVATDAINGRMKLFSELESPDVCIADAVVASMSIPGIVKAYEIEGVSYFDGGIVSNRPAWAFDFEHTLDPDLKTILFGIGKKSSPDPQIKIYKSKRKLSLFFTALYAGIIGENSLETKQSDRIQILTVHPQSVGLLDFDMTADQRRAYVSAGYEMTKYNFERIFVHQPKLYKLAADNVKELLRTLMKEQGNLTDQLPETKILFSERLKRGQVLKIVYSSGDIGRDTDDRLLLPIDATKAGECYDGRRVILGNISQNTEKQGFALPRDRYRKPLKMMGQRITINIPVMGDDPTSETDPVGVVIIETEADLSTFGLSGNTDSSSWTALRAQVNSSFIRAYRIKSKLLSESGNATQGLLSKSTDFAYVP